MRFFVLLAGLLSVSQSFGADIVGGGLRVLSVRGLDSTRVSITVQATPAAETYVVDCIGATWGYEGGGLSPVKADQRSQALAERACRGFDFKAEMVSSAGAWKAPKSDVPISRRQATSQGPSYLSPEPLAVPSDPKARFHVLGVDDYKDNVAIITHRVSPSGESFSLREVDCSQATVRYLGTGETKEQMEVFRPDPHMSEIVPGAIAFYVARRACKGRPETISILR